LVKALIFLLDYNICINPFGMKYIWPSCINISLTSFAILNSFVQANTTQTLSQKKTCNAALKFGQNY